MRLCMRTITMILLTSFLSACATDDAEPEDDPGAEGDPSIYANDGAIDEDITTGMDEVDMEASLERASGHRIVATPANLDLFKHGCYHSVVLDWSCARGDDGRHANFTHKRETGANATEVADNFGGFWGECVSLVKAATKNNATTSTWRRGAGVFSGLASGTAIATFPGGHYSGHTAIFLSYVRSGGSIVGIRVADQNWLAREVKRHVIRRTGSGVSDADNYFAVVVP
jgi:hypothetical protein